MRETLIGAGSTCSVAAIREDIREDVGRRAVRRKEGSELGKLERIF